MIKRDYDNDQNNQTSKFYTWWTWYWISCKYGREGRFGNRTEVVRAGLRLLEDYENNEKIKRLRALIAEGDADIEAGRITEYDNAQEFENSITR